MECSFNTYNHVLLEALNPQHPNCAELLQWVRQPPSTYNYDAGHHHEQQTRIAGSGHKLWMMLDDPPALRSGEEIKEEDDDDVSSFYTVNTKISINKLLLIKKKGSQGLAESSTAFEQHDWRHQNQLLSFSSL